MAVIVTGTKYLENDEIRFSLACRTIEAAVAHNISIFITDAGSPSYMRDRFISLGASLLKDIVGPMGYARREGITQVLSLTDEADLIVWLEPEKYDFVRSIHLIEKRMHNEGADIALPRRKTRQWRATYPLEQWHLESAFNVMIAYYMGGYFDFTFGPMAVNRTAADFFLSYTGEYGDMWEALIIPVIRANRAGLKIIDVPVDYNHPKIQKHAEEGHTEFISKRISQISHLWRATLTEIKKGS